MSPCPGAGYRAAMNAAEFWEHVLLGPDAKYDKDHDPDDDPNAPRLRRRGTTDDPRHPGGRR